MGSLSSAGVYNRLDVAAIQAEVQKLEGVPIHLRMARRLDESTASLIDGRFDSKDASCLRRVAGRLSLSESISICESELTTVGLPVFYQIISRVIAGYSGFMPKSMKRISVSIEGGYAFSDYAQTEEYRKLADYLGGLEISSFNNVSMIDAASPFFIAQQSLKKNRLPMCVLAHVIYCTGRQLNMKLAAHKEIFKLLKAKIPGDELTGTQGGEAH